MADRVEDGRRVADAAGHRAVDRAAGPGLADERALTDPGPGRLEADQAALAGRDADRPATVVGVRDRHHPAGDRRRRPARRAAGAVAGVPRVAGGREAERLGGDRGTELGRVGPAERDEPGLLELLGQERRDRHRYVAHRPDPARRRLALDDAAEILVQDRYAPEGAVAGGVAGFLPRLVEAGPDDRVELRVECFDAGDRRLDEFLRANLTGADQLGLSGRVEPRCVGHLSHATDEYTRAEGYRVKARAACWCAPDSIHGRWIAWRAGSFRAHRLVTISEIAEMPISATSGTYSRISRSACSRSRSRSVNLHGVETRGENRYATAHRVHRDRRRPLGP